MRSSGEKKWKICCILMAVIILALIANTVGMYRQNAALKKNLTNSINAEWYQLYSLFERIDKYYIKNDFQKATVQVVRESDMPSFCNDRAAQ